MTKRNDDPKDHLPLAPATFHILVSLADGPRHGYAIMKEVEARSDGAVRLGPGTLYGALKRLLDAGMVEESEEEGDSDDERRRYYRLTRFGLQVAKAEAQRLDSIVRLARRKKLIGAEHA